MEQQDLTLVGLTEDKTRLVLVGDSGEEYSLPADTTLLAALGAPAHLGAKDDAMDDQLEIRMESALRPRDIQARIRAGETPENVAVVAKTTVEKIMNYATPVLAERAHIADRAQRASVRRKGAEGPSRILADAVAERLSSRSVDPHTVEWDAWRREDGRWTVVADYHSGESRRHAEFVFDAPGRYVVADDDEARWLVGEQSTRNGPQPRAGGGSRRLTAVSREDDELPLGEDAIGLVTEDPAGADLDEHTVDLTETVETVRENDVEPAEEDAATPEDVENREPEAPTRKQAKKSRGRASVPSWDEIMFGGGKND